MPTGNAEAVDGLVAEMMVPFAVRQDRGRYVAAAPDGVIARDPLVPVCV